MGDGDDGSSADHSFSPLSYVWRERKEGRNKRFAGFDIPHNNKSVKFIQIYQLNIGGHQEVPINMHLPFPIKSPLTVYF